MTARPLTLMAVHAHPDDEATSTGGILARYAGQGIRTVLVTCTNGEMGDAPGGIKPGEPGHDEAAVVALRAEELEESCRILGITHLERLGYRDSGMVGWPSNDAPGAFWHVPVPTAAAPLAGLIERYQPDVVVTYDPNGFYGHPDHIQAHRITLAALDAAGSTARLYYPTIRRSRLAAFRRPPGRCRCRSSRHRRERVRLARRGHRRDRRLPRAGRRQAGRTGGASGASRTTCSS